MASTNLNQTPELPVECGPVVDEAVKNLGDIFAVLRKDLGIEGELVHKGVAAILGVGHNDNSHIVG